jgi:hypothetical protein
LPEEGLTGPMTTSFQSILFYSNSPIKGFVYRLRKNGKLSMHISDQCDSSEINFDFGLQIVMKEITEPGVEYLHTVSHHVVILKLAAP